MQTLNYTDYLDKVRGGWLGKCLGGAAGAPVEGVKAISGIRSFRDIIDTSLPNDDLDIQLLWLELLQDKGPYFTQLDMAEYWDKKCWYPFSEYGYFLKNYERGIAPPLSGTFNNPFFKEGMGSPIRSEIWGMIFPGDSAKAAAFAEKDATLDHAENSVWAEKFLAALEAAAFFEQDIRTLVNMAAHVVPAGSKLAQLLDVVLADADGDVPWRESAAHVRSRFGHPDFTNSPQNMGFMLIALLHGDGDMEKSLDIALQCGYDADCTCATVGAVLGIRTGYDALPTDLKALVNDKIVIGIDVCRTDDSLLALAEDTCAIGLGIAAAGENAVAAFAAVPAQMAIPVWEKPKPAFLITVDYLTLPAIGAGADATVRLTVRSLEDEAFEGTLTLCSHNPTLRWNVQEVSLLLPPHGQYTLEAVASLADNTLIPQTNLTTAVLSDRKGQVKVQADFGLAGSWPFRLYGPFIEQLVTEPGPDSMPNHGDGCTLPSLEEMVNNQVFLNKAYLDEEALIAGHGAPQQYAGIVNAAEDLIPVDRAFGIQGQIAFYLETEVLFPQDATAWLVIGHSDAYRLYLNGELIAERDEIRLWTPYNSFVCANFRSGRNRILIKALRRTEHFQFSIGIRRFRENKFYHACRWHTDLTYRLPDGPPAAAVALLPEQAIRVVAFREEGKPGVPAGKRPRERSAAASAYR